MVEGSLDRLLSAEGLILVALFVYGAVEIAERIAAAKGSEPRDHFLTILAVAMIREVRDVLDGLTDGYGQKICLIVVGTPAIGFLFSLLLLGKEDLIASFLGAQGDIGSGESTAFLALLGLLALFWVPFAAGINANLMGYFDQQIAERAADQGSPLRNAPQPNDLPESQEEQPSSSR